MCVCCGSVRVELVSGTRMEIHRWLYTHRVCNPNHLRMRVTAIESCQLFFRLRIESISPSRSDFSFSLEKTNKHVENKNVGNDATSTKWISSLSIHRKPNQVDTPMDINDTFYSLATCPFTRSNFILKKESKNSKNLNDFITVFWSSASCFFVRFRSSMSRSWWSPVQ